MKTGPALTLADAIATKRIGGRTLPSVECYAGDLSAICQGDVTWAPLVPLRGLQAEGMQVRDG